MVEHTRGLDFSNSKSLKPKSRSEHIRVLQFQPIRNATSYLMSKKTIEDQLIAKLLIVI
jgi:hypothetical protein